MSYEEIQRYIALGSMLVQTGMATVHQFQAIMALLHPGMSEEDINTILTAVRDDSKRRVLLARMDQALALADGAQP